MMDFNLETTKPGVLVIISWIETRSLPTLTRSFPRRLRQSGSDPSKSLFPIAPFLGS